MSRQTAGKHRKHCNAIGDRDSLYCIGMNYAVVQEHERGVRRGVYAVNERDEDLV